MTSCKEIVFCKITLLVLYIIALSSIPLESFAADFGKNKLELRNSQYTNSGLDSFRDGASAQTMSWRIDLRGERQSKKWDYFWDLRHDYLAQEDAHYFKPNELNIKWKGQDTELIIGRHKETWSEQDEHFKQGLWHPRFLDDGIERSTAGFVGLFARNKNGPVKMTLLVSPLWIPDISPDFKLQKYQLKSKNPWFKPPPSQVSIDGRLTATRYQFSRPEYAEIISQGMIAAKTEWLDENGFWARASSTYKPINQLLIGFPLELHLQDPNYVNIDIKTRIVYHQVSTIELGLQEQDGWNGWGSVSYEKVFRDQTPQEWTTQEVKDSLVSSLNVSYNWWGTGVNSSQLSLSYLQIDGGVAPDQGEFQSTTSLFENRFQWMQAVELGIRHSAMIISNQFLSQLKGSLTYDLRQNGMLLGLEWYQPWSKDWSSFISGDWLGLTESKENPVGFVSDFRANDRLSLGVNYVF